MGGKPLDKDYYKKYYEKNKEKLQKQSKEYRSINAEKIRQAKKKYGSRPEVKQHKKEINAQDYLKNREKVLLRQETRRKERLDFINGIALKYGCQNKDCGWDAELLGLQLEFHHYDPLTKITEVSTLDSSTYEKIIAEINKCVVLCKNCHALFHAGFVNLNESMKCNEILRCNNE